MIRRLAVAACLLALGAAAAGAHGVLDRTDPRAGVSVKSAPSQVRLWFTGALAPGEVASTEARTTHSRYLQLVLEGIGVTEPDLVEAMDEWRRGHNQPLGLWTAPEPDAAPALMLAREAGLRTGVISNSNGTIRQILARLRLMSLVDFALDSHEEGVEKPRREIFERALARAGVGASEAAYVGDLY